MSVSHDRILLTSNLPCLFATLASQIVTLPNPYDEDAIHAYILYRPSTACTPMGMIILSSCHEPYRRARIPHEDESPWVKRLKVENGFLACLLELPQTPSHWR